MGTKPHDHPQPSLEDVETALREVSATHCCDLKIELIPPVRPGTPVLFWIKVEAFPRIVGRKTIRNRHAVSNRWPTVDCRDLEALMLRLVYKIDSELTKMGHVAAEQAQFDWAREM
jgi:hypothetical protein